MLVVCNHAALLALKFLNPPGAEPGTSIWNLAHFGAVGVDVFFVISGFVMAMSAQRFEGAADSARFLAQRYNRIAPLFYLLSAVLFADILRAGVPYSALEVFNTLAFIPWLDGSDYHWPIHYLGWTLAFEFVFYLVVAALIWRGRGRNALLLAGVLIVLVASGSVVSIAWMPWLMLTSPMMIEFAFGVLLYAAFSRGGFDRAGGLWRGLGLLAVAMLIWPNFSGSLVIHDVVTTQLSRDGAALRLLWWGLPALFIVAAFLTLTPRRDGILRRVAVAIGDATYSIYLTHLFVVRIGEEVIERSSLSPLVVALAVVLVSPIAGILCYRLVEAPLMRRGQRLISRRFSRGPAASTAAPGR